MAEGIRRKTKLQYQELGAEYDIRLCARQWTLCESIISEMSGNHIIKITYENLTEKTYQTLNEIARFLNIDPFSKDLTDHQWLIHEKKVRLQI